MLHPSRQAPPPSILVASFRRSTCSFKGGGKGGKLQERQQMSQRRKTSRYAVVDGVKHTSVKPKTVF